VVLSGSSPGETVTGDGVHPCVTGFAWSLAQSVRRYAAWAVELTVAGALAAAMLTPFGQLAAAATSGERPGVTAGAALWLLVVAALAALIRSRDPLRQAAGWREAATLLRATTRRHPLLTVVSIPVLLLGTFDAAGAATPGLVQQLLQLLPALAAVNLAGFGTAAVLTAVALPLAERWVAERNQAAAKRAINLAMAAPLGFVLCLVAASWLGWSAPSPITAVGLGGLSVGIGIAIALLDGRGATRIRPRAWMGAVAAGGLAAAGAGAEPGLLVIGALLGGAAGAGLEVGVRFVRSETILWRHRAELPLTSGEVVYCLDGRSMEITLEASAGEAEATGVRRVDGGYLTADGWRVTQLTPQCWEGSKGRAQLLGPRRADLVGVISILHPEAPLR